MTRSGPAHRTMRWAWVLLAVVVWNALYDLRITLGVRDYLLQQALHEAGRGQAVTIAEAMEATVRDAVMVASLWAALILAAGLWTVRSLRLPAGTPEAHRTRPPDQRLGA